LRDAALANVKAGERQCSQFNRIGYIRLFEDSGLPSTFLTHAQNFVFRVLGPFYRDKVMKWCRHGPGTSVGTKKDHENVYFKYAQWPYSVSSRAFRHAECLIRSDPRWWGALEEDYRLVNGIRENEILDYEKFFSNVFSVVKGNRITTVPKDGRKDRPIAIEPTMNLMLQLGVDGYIRKRLRRWGINLDSAYSNRVLAREGSIRKDADSPCTLDLANASDTISLRIAKLLIPGDWYEYLCDLRSPEGELPDGTRLRYSKLSSMGNGTTFAVETLVFAAIAYAASMDVYGSWQRGQIVIFGDDIIVPEAMARHTAHYLQICGFSLNTEKSFFEGGVKESCGTDWVRGRNVRPVHLSKVPADVTHLYTVLNQLNRWFLQHIGRKPQCVTSLISNWIPEHLMLYGPISDDEFDTYIHTDEPGLYKDWSYWWKCIQRSPRRRGANKLPFRKLMNALRPGPIVASVYSKEYARVASAFVVTVRNRSTLSVKTRRTPFWNDAYSPADSIRRDQPSWLTESGH